MNLMNPKYKLSDATSEEQQAFLKDFNDLLNKHSMYYEPIPAFEREDISKPWKLVFKIWLQKKKEIVEVEKDSIPSPFVENNEPPEETK